MSGLSIIAGFRFGQMLSIDKILLTAAACRAVGADHIR